MLLKNDIYSQLKNYWSFRNFFSLNKIIGRAIMLPLNMIDNGYSSRPLAVNFLITTRCNLNCVLCSARELQCAQELKTGQIAQLIDKLSRYKAGIFIGGGEPFIREDIVKVIEMIKLKGLRCGVVTNGTLLDDSSIKKLINTGLDNIVFSFLGPQDIHDEMTNCPGTYEKLYNNAREFSRQKKGTKIIANCVICSKNYLRLEDMVDIGKQIRADMVRFEFLSFLTPQEIANINRIDNGSRAGNDANFKVSTYTYKPEENIQIDKLLQAIKRIKQKYKGFVQFKPYLSNGDIKQWYCDGFSATLKRKCFFVWNSCFIKPNGEVMPCQFYSNYKIGSLLESSLDKIWNNVPYRALRNKLKNRLLPGCVRCCKL